MRDMLNGANATGTFLDQFTDGYLRSMWDGFVQRRDASLHEFTEMSVEVNRIEKELERRKADRVQERSSSDPKEDD